MLSTIADAVWSAPVVDYHALAPEIVLGGGIVLLLLLDLFVADAIRSGKPDPGTGRNINIFFG